MEEDWEEKKAVELAPELVIGLVGSVGVNLSKLSEELATALREVRYDSRPVRLSELLHSLPWTSPLPTRDDVSRDEYIQAHQDRGDHLRRITESGDALAVMAIARLRSIRAKQAQAHGRRAERKDADTSEPDAQAVESDRDSSPNQSELQPHERLDAKEMLVRWHRQSEAPVARCAFILRSLKHPDEARTLRSVYGPRFILIAAHVPREQAINRLANEIAHSEDTHVADEHKERARRLYDREARPEEKYSDEERNRQRQEGDPDNDFGQNVRDTYRHADCFVDASDDEVMRDELLRLVKLLFGDPFLTPTRHELAMFQAHAASLRSSALARQVGATVLDDNGALIACGTNEVPRAGGGLYWEGDSPDGRDFAHEDGADSSDVMRRHVIRQILEQLEELELLNADFDKLKASDVLPALKGATVGRLLEFGRPVHAEMAAITDAARRGCAVARGSLYTTTYPCHACARHIVAAGIREVQYMEPYAKSLARNLHDDAIQLDAPLEGDSTSKVVFRQFLGVAPRRFRELFQRHAGERKDHKGHARSFSMKSAVPRGIDAEPFYQLTEFANIHRLNVRLKGVGLSPAELLDDASYEQGDLT
jgi:Deoxycytidylate deaminase